MRYLLPLWIGCLLHVSVVLGQTANADQVQAIPRYQKAGYLEHVQVEMAYASSKIRNPEVAAEWADRKIERIDLVFTQYPQDISKWLTPYQTFLTTRLDALKRLDSSLFQQPGIEWRYLQQTDCPTEGAAMEMFHGFVIYFESLGRRMDDVAAITYQQAELKDSTAFDILERNPDWGNMLVVMDWTGSMYKYGASVLLWHRLNMERDAVKHFIFFNDGAGKSNSNKEAGRTGGIYRVETNDIDNVLRKMNEVMQDGNGGDDEENDVEALYKGIKFLDGYNEVILIADNHSKMRDLHLAEHITRPVKVILCGVDKKHPIHPDYLTLARTTGGSVHTIEEDINDLKALNEGLEITIQGRQYIIEDGRFRLLPVADRM